MESSAGQYIQHNLIKPNPGSGRMYNIKSQCMNICSFNLTKHLPIQGKTSFTAHHEHICNKSYVKKNSLLPVVSMS